MNPGDLVVTGRTGSLHERMSAPAAHERHARPGPDSIYRTAAQLLGDLASAEVAPGFYVQRTTDGISLSTGNLRARMDSEAEPNAAPSVAPEAPPELPTLEPRADRLRRFLAKRVDL